MFCNMRNDKSMPSQVPRKKATEEESDLFRVVCACVCVSFSRRVWPIVIQASERLATHVVLDASVAEGRAPPAPFTFSQK